MFTQNYINWQKMMFNFENFGSFVDTVGVSLSANVNYCANANIGRLIKSPRCRTVNLDASESSSAITNGSISRSAITGLYFGSGSTAPTKDDYTLESVITSGLSLTAGATVVDNNEGQHTISASHMVTNTTSEEIVIREIGVFGEVGRYSNGKYYYHMVLFERTVLADPIVIAPNQSKMVNYVLTFNQPS